MTESEFQTHVIQWARLNGWLVSHFRPARTAQGWRTPIQGDAGFCDLVMARNGHVIIVELKTDKGRVKEDQQRWLEQLAAAPIEKLDKRECLGRLVTPQLLVGVWRPRLWELIEDWIRDWGARA